MATVTETKSAAQEALDRADKALLEASAEVDRLSKDLAEARSTVERLDAQYEEQCRFAAMGKEADPAAILAERDRRQHRIRGLEVLLAEASAKAEPLAIERNVAADEVLREGQTAKEQELTAAIEAADSVLRGAREVVAKAEGDVRAAVKARDVFRRGIQNAIWRKDRGLQP
jgi:hypothetical protein